MDERLEKLIKEVADRNPELVAKFGNPLDKDDPRNWTPTERAEKGLSTEEQLRLLGLDMESQQHGVSLLVGRLFDLEFQLDKLQKWAAEKMADDFVRMVREDPDKAADYMKRMLELGESGNEPRGEWGPLENDPNASIRYAGSSQGIAPDQMVETPDGIIRGDEIPGYVNDPNWRPSPDWMDANCMCPTHVAKRENGKDDNPFGGTGMYL